MSNINVYKLAESALIFKSLPCITVEDKEDNYVLCDKDCGYIPHLYAYEDGYVIDWIGDEGDTLKCIKSDTMEDAIHSAYVWCKEHKLING